MKSSFGCYSSKSLFGFQSWELCIENILLESKFIDPVDKTPVAVLTNQKFSSLHKQCARRNDPFYNAIKMSTLLQTQSLGHRE